MRADEELGCSREVVEILIIDFMKLSYIILQVQYYSAYPLGFDYTPHAVEYIPIPWI